jgi:hypothetical protein
VQFGLRSPAAVGAAVVQVAVRDIHRHIDPRTDRRIDREDRLAGTGPVGLVQVRITIYNSKITNVDVLHHPDANSRDRAIMSSALPTLGPVNPRCAERHIDMVSGAESPPTATSSPS